MTGDGMAEKLVKANTGLSIQEIFCMPPVRDIKPRLTLPDRDGLVNRSDQVST